MATLRPRLGRKAARVDVLNEKTSSAGVTIEGVPIEDSLIDGISAAALVEYAATETDLGGFYRKVISFGAFTTGEASASTAHGITGLSQVWHIGGYVIDGTLTMPIGGNTNLVVEVTTSTVEIVSTTFPYSFSYDGAEVVLEYTKT